MSKHAADQSATTAVREHVAAALARIGQYQRGYGTHRADWSAIKIRIINGRDECEPCERIRIARNKADA